MGFLNPWFLLAAASIAVPLFLHLFHRQEAQRVAFPALRYLKRTEKEHARRIRLRQLLLMILRIAALLLLVGAGARTFLTGPTSAHPPTALAIVIDNSASSGAVLDDELVLDRLRRAALASLADATDRDEVWVIRAGDPDDLAPRSSPEDARERVLDTAVTDSYADLDEVLRRAEALVASSDLDAKEVHLVSDLQASAFPEEVRRLSVPVRAWVPDWPPPPNRAVGEVLVGGGLAPITNQRSEISADLTAPPEQRGDSVPVRLVIDGRVAGATVAPLGATVVFPLPPLPPGTVEGHVEIDADGLAADDRRHFVFRAEAPPVVAVGGTASPFLESALDVLAESGRIRRGSPAELVFAVDGEGIATRTPGQTVVVVPSGDEARLGAMNRRLSDARIPWRYEEAAGGERTPSALDLPVDLSSVRVTRHHPLTPAEEPAGVIATLDSDRPWITRTESELGTVVLVGSALSSTAGDLVVGPALVPLLEWLVASRGGTHQGTTAVMVGSPLPLTENVSAVADPQGRVVPLTEGRATATHAGFYSLLAADTVVRRVAANVPRAESELRRAEPSDLAARYGPSFRAVPGDEWESGIFAVRQGPEVWWPMVLAALVCLLAESWVAASGVRTQTGPLTARPSPSR